MTHYDVDYSNLTPQAKFNRAISDIKDYMGEEHYNKVVSLFKQEQPPPLEVFHMHMSFAGVQGYPVVALYDEIWPCG